jgi:hypothetical protein
MHVHTFLGYIILQENKLIEIFTLAFMMWAEGKFFILFFLYALQHTGEPG